MPNSYNTINDQLVYKFIEQNNFNDAAIRLLEKQRETWPALNSGINSLRLIKLKPIQFDGFSFQIQYNPGRYMSTSAMVDDKSIKNRKCFLCPDNLPKEQEGIIVNDYILLANPYPIFPKHFTISNLIHKPQRIENSFEELLFFSKILSKDFSVFYNGPLCGASAPDHLHFQAVSNYLMPLENEFKSIKKKYGQPFPDNNCNLTMINDGLRKIISFESKEKQNIIRAFNSFYKVYSYKSDLIEPMMNILSSYTEELGWRVLVMLRAKHRPAAFYKAGDEKLLYSPAATDYGGLCVLPIENDFIKLDKVLLKSIFHEISISDAEFHSLREKLKLFLTHQIA